MQIVIVIGFVIALGILATPDPFPSRTDWRNVPRDNIPGLDRRGPGH